MTKQTKKDLLTILFIAVVAYLLVWLFPIPTKADERATLSNVLLIEQAVDITTSQSIFRHGGYERDPLATKSLTGELVEAGVFQALARNPHTSLHLLQGAVLVYPVILGNNIRVIMSWK